MPTIIYSMSSIGKNFDSSLKSNFERALSHRSVLCDAYFQDDGIWSRVFHLWSACGELEELLYCLWHWRSKTFIAWFIRQLSSSSQTHDTTQVLPLHSQIYLHCHYFMGFLCSVFETLLQLTIKYYYDNLVVLNAFGNFERNIFFLI